MNYANPTQIRIGLHGNFAGQDYRVLGRVVLGETEDGGTYYWNEFNLRAADGSFADLVYEETENGVRWRLFTMFDPEFELTAEDAATKRVGDRLNLTGEEVRITFRGRSRVYHIEGEAPEGVGIGSLAEYFNAEAGTTMQVVSWTANEVECYTGVSLAGGVINAAFNLAMAHAPLKLDRRDGGDLDAAAQNYSRLPKFWLQIGMALLLFLIIFGPRFSCIHNRGSAPLQKIPATVPPLASGEAGTLLGKHYRVTTGAEVEIDENNRIFFWHEYQLTSDDGGSADLICGLNPDDKHWELFTPVETGFPPRAVDCATKRPGDIIYASQTTGRVANLFYSTFSQIDGTPGGDWPNGNSQFGYIAQADSGPLLVRWNNGFPSVVTVERGRILSAETANTAFAHK